MQTKIIPAVYLLSIGIIFCSCGEDNPSEPTNRPPVITALNAVPNIVNPLESAVLICSANDPDGDNLNYVWTASSGSITGSADSVNWHAPDSTGAVTVNCKVMDGHGGEDQMQTEIKVEFLIPTDGLIAYWPFNGNANDESGNGIDGTVLGPILTGDRHGNNNSAYSFDGQNDYIEADASKLPTAERTISLWFFANTVDNRPGLLGYGGGTTRGTTWFMGLNLNGLKSFHMSCHWLINRIDYYYTTPPVNEWYHWVITTNINGTKLYVNGIERVSNTTFVSNTYVIGKELGIGVIASTTGNVPYTDGNVKYFNGIIDDIRIYNRALNEMEIQALYHENGWNN